MRTTANETRTFKIFCKCNENCLKQHQGTHLQYFLHLVLPFWFSISSSWFSADCLPCGRRSHDKAHIFISLFKKPAPWEATFPWPQFQISREGILIGSTEIKCLPVLCLISHGQADSHKIKHGYMVPPKYLWIHLLKNIWGYTIWQRQHTTVLSLSK